jgi:hypothetical protein
MIIAACTAAAWALVAASPSHGSERSLTDTDDTGLLLAQGLTIPPPRIDATPPPASRDAADREIAQLRNTVRALTGALALANNEAEVFKRQATELSLRIEALGVPGIGGDPSKIEQRLLGAVRDLGLARERREATEAQLVRLIEAIQILIATTEGINPDLRMGVETEIRRTNQLLGVPVAQQPAAVQPSLTEAMVGMVKEDLSLVIANVGAVHGARIGMPFQVWRGTTRIGDVLVIDVRDSVSGAIIQNLSDENQPIQPGDRLRVDAKK